MWKSLKFVEFGDLKNIDLKLKLIILKLNIHKYQYKPSRIQFNILIYFENFKIRMKR